MLHTSSYFAGVATVVATMALGFGGGVLLTDAFVGKSENPPTLIERRAAPLAEATATTVATAAPAETPAPQVSASPQPTAPSQTASAPPVVATPNPPPAPAIAAPQQQPITEAAAATPANATPVAVQAPAPALSEPPQRQFDQAMAKAREDEIRKAQAAERRKFERRKWAERRKQEARKLEELDAVSEKVREVEREPEPVRSFFAQSPRIRLFEAD